ncbi:MAG: HlyD family secretion protein [Peptococcaceae bacterium]|nr:MAG: HlyD family secretion protein [Peptococcaceae bacterium]
MGKKIVIWVVVVLMVLTLAGITYYYWQKNNLYVDTEDAKVDGAIVKVSPQMVGKIVELNVDEGDLVKAGDILARQADLTLPPGTNLDLAIIKAPISGVVLKRIGNVGEVGAPGQPVLMLADLNGLYITANVEEKKLSRIKPGQLVDFTIDAVPAVKYTGRVESIGEATISTFSLLPTQNTGGNFTKVTQRIPVKIKIYNYQGRRLLPGMNAIVRIHIKQ